MDARRFDRLARLLASAASRRAALAGLAAALVSTLEPARAQSGCASWQVLLPNGTCANPCPAEPDGNLTCMHQYCEACSLSTDGQGYCYRYQLPTRCSSHLECPPGYFCWAGAGYCQGACGG